MRSWIVTAASLALAGMGAPVPARAAELELARDGRTGHRIVVAVDASAPERLAASELAAYLRRITGADFRVDTAARGAKPIVLRARSRDDGIAAAEDYTIAVRGDSLLLTGGSGRAVLFAAYDLLERLGVEWLAPELAHYEGAHEVVPRRRTLAYRATGDVVERPRFGLRKLDVEEGMSHDVESLRRIVAWMPKARYNTLQVPIDYQGRGRVRWDAWREALTPELDRRGLLVEVGGHGYQNFLNAEMEGGRLFREHPEWFGRDSSCAPSPAQHLVFDTEHPDAVRFVIDRVVAYLAARPEIDVFDFWPPDGARWAECGEWKGRGTPEDRQAKLVNALAAELRRVRPDVRVEMIAYALAKLPPRTVALDPGVLVDFCPIGQNFDVAIDDSTGANNRQYVEAVGEWRRTFRGDLGLYSYYRRYAWRSLPMVLPRYIAHDVRWWAAQGARAASTYAEPGDWFTYEINHFVLARLAWNPDVALEPLLDRLARARYGAAWREARAALGTLEDALRVYGSIPYSSPKPPERIASARALLERRAHALDAARGGLRGPAAASARKLALMLDFARRDLELQEARARRVPPAELRPMVERLMAVLHANRDAGVVLLYRADDAARYLRHYGVSGAAAPAETD